MALYCGIDLHINNHVIVVINDEDRSLARKRCANQLEQTLELLEPFREGLVGVAIESTPNWYWLRDGLVDHGYRPQLVNVLAVKPYEGRKHTDDHDDAFHLAHLMRLGILPTVNVLPRKHRWLRDVLRRRSQLVRMQTSGLLMQSNLLSRELGWHGRVREVESMDWHDPSLALNWDVIDCLTESTQKLIRRIERHIFTHLKDLGDYRLIRTIPGIGPILAATIVMETGPISRFKKAGNYASYSRLVDASRWSNGKKKANNNRKAGNKYLSWAFHEAAHHARCHQSAAQKFYQRKVSQSNRLVAIRALARKLCRAVFHMLRDEVAYDERRLFH